MEPTMTLPLIALLAAVAFLLRPLLWGTSGNPEAVAGDVGATGLARIVAGISIVAGHYYGTADPDDGSWGAAELGRYWINATNEINASGDDIGPVISRWSMLTDDPTYGWRTLNAIALVDVSPNVNKVDTAGQATTGFADVDVTAETSALATAVLLAVEVAESTTPGAGVYASFRPNGVTTDAQEQRVYPQVAAIPVTAFLRVPLDAEQVFEYDINASGATFSVRIDVVGYEERG